MLRKAMVGMAIVGLSAVDAYSVLHPVVMMSLLLLMAHQLPHMVHQLPHTVNLLPLMENQLPHMENQLQPMEQMKQLCQTSHQSLLVSLHLSACHSCSHNLLT